MFDINTILNAALTAAVESAIKPLTERIEAQDKVITELNVFIAQWNFNEGGFKKAVIDLIENDHEVVTAVTDCATDKIGQRMDIYMENYDFNDAISSSIGDIDEKVQEAVDKVVGDIEDKLDNIKEEAKDAAVEYISNNISISIG